MTYECNHRSRYTSINGSNDPRFATNRFHMASNVTMIAASVSSMVSGFEVAAMDADRRCASDVVGRAFKTFKPTPFEMREGLI